MLERFDDAGLSDLMAIRLMAAILLLVIFIVLVVQFSSDTLMKEMHLQGVTINDIVEVLKRTPIHPRIVPAIKAAHSAGCDLRIVSDANMFFIETILDFLGIKDCFSEINTNPGYVDEQERLRILPYHDFTKSPHGCSNPD
ncbi:inorganic pyrophosphatase 1-like [Amaranthus tricolor]|uniref:inorganic pyrophosphatase 1-like n=1 Tax=Amaranthus tricolor TaxID=29722 RepID=UPI00258D88A9|nr:inorganic pyrophosphatase 1-like [Amaranthus tricolor]